VLGNGDVLLWAVPTIQYLLDLAGSSIEESDAAMQEQNPDGAAAQGTEQQQQQQHGALSLQLKPLMVLAASAVGGSLASCCRWLPAAPHDQMLVGFWDGQVAIWRLSPSPAGEHHPVVGQVPHVGARPGMCCLPPELLLGAKG
jgi:general transcription factor 3C polypeptide 2